MHIFFHILPFFLHILHIFLHILPGAPGGIGHTSGQAHSPRRARPRARAGPAGQDPPAPAAAALAPSAAGEPRGGVVEDEASEGGGEGGEVEQRGPLLQHLPEGEGAAQGALGALQTRLAVGAARGRAVRLAVGPNEAAWRAA